jgi:hypothetical protein
MPKRHGINMSIMPMRQGINMYIMLTGKENKIM